MGQKIGILGGSFNPIHVGHLQMARQAKAELSLDRLILIPAGDPPHKSDGLAPQKHRLRMTELAADGEFEVSGIEVEREGKTYTIDTVHALLSTIPGAKLVFIIGVDTLRELLTWKEVEQVFSLCEFAVFARDNVPPIVPDGAKVLMMRSKIAPVSATEIRGRVTKGLSLSRFTPSAVEAYIGEHRLYDPPRMMGEDEILSHLQNDLSKERLKHVLGVRQVILSLAKRWGYDESRASVTALLHDCAKSMSLGSMRAFMEAQGATVDEPRKVSAQLLHAPASAERARAFFGMTDPLIGKAIWHHNTGCVPMDLLSKLLFVADCIEPNRRIFPALSEIRRLSALDLDAAVLEVFQSKLDYIRLKGYPEHPDTARAFAALKYELEVSSWE